MQILIKEKKEKPEKKITGKRRNSRFEKKEILWQCDCDLTDGKKHKENCIYNLV